MKINGTKLRIFRRQKGLKVRELSAIAELSDSRITQIESLARVDVNIHVLKAITGKLGIHPDDLL